MKTDTHRHKQVVMHSYYEKPVTSKLVMMSKTAHPQKQKMTTLSQEVVRRMRNTSRKVVTSERIEKLQKYHKKMKDSGYNEEMRKEVVKAGITGYYNMVEKEITGVRRVNRTVTEGKRDRDIRKGVNISLFPNFSILSQIRREILLIQNLGCGESTGAAPVQLFFGESKTSLALTHLIVTSKF